MADFNIHHFHFYFNPDCGLKLGPDFNPNPDGNGGIEIGISWFSRGFRHTVLPNRSVALFMCDFCVSSLGVIGRSCEKKRERATKHGMVQQ